MALTGVFQKISNRQGLHRYLLATLAGWLLPLSFAPYNYWFITPFAICLLLIAMKGGRSAVELSGHFKTNFILGWFFGLG
ncbi:hypothetical protein ABMA58_10085, partial [Oceanospirillum sp. HFRX-1_2]